MSCRILIYSKAPMRIGRLLRIVLTYRILSHPVLSYPIQSISYSLIRDDSTAWQVNTFTMNMMQTFTTMVLVLQADCFGTFPVSPPDVIRPTMRNLRLFFQSLLTLTLKHTPSEMLALSHSLWQQPAAAAHCRKHGLLVHHVLYQSSLSRTGGSNWLDPCSLRFELLGDKATSGAEPEDIPITAVAAMRGPVIVCPAMFGTVKDYTDLVDGLRRRGHPVRVMPLKYTDWFTAALQLVPASLTDDFWRNEMRPEVALSFYFKALDAATAQMQREMQAEGGVEEPIQLVAHSIGGWAARAYLGQLSPEKRAAYGALVTLGTPTDSVFVVHVWHVQCVAHAAQRTGRALNVRGVVCARYTALAAAQGSAAHPRPNTRSPHVRSGELSWCVPPRDTLPHRGKPRGARRARNRARWPARRRYLPTSVRRRFHGR